MNTKWISTIPAAQLELIMVGNLNLYSAVPLVHLADTQLNYLPVRITPECEPETRVASAVHPIGRLPER